MTIKVNVEGKILEYNTLYEADCRIAGARRQGHSAFRVDQFEHLAEEVRESRMRNAFYVVAPGEVIAISADFEANFSAEIYAEVKGDRKYVPFSRVQVDHELALQSSLDLDSLKEIGFELSRDERENVLYLASTWAYKQGTCK